MSTIQGVVLGFVVTLFLGLGVVIFWQHHTIHEQQTRYEELLKNSSALQVENVNWKTAVEQQNKKIQAIAVRVVKKDTAVAARVKSYSTFVARLHALQVSGDDCDGARIIKSFYLNNQP